MTASNGRLIDEQTRQQKVRQLVKYRRNVADLEDQLGVSSAQQRDDPDLDDTEQEAVLAADRVAMMSNLARAIAHEINNPLSTCLGYLDRAFDQVVQLDQADALEATLEHVRGGIERIHGIVAELQMLSEDTVGEREKLDLADIVDRVCSLVPPELRAGLAVDTEPVVVSVYRPRAYQMMYNILLPYLLAAANDAAAEGVDVECGPDADGRAVLEITGCATPRSGAHADLLAVLRGEYTPNTLPRRLARRLAGELDADWREDTSESGTHRTKITFPVP